MFRNTFQASDPPHPPASSAPAGLSADRQRIFGLHSGPSPLSRRVLTWAGLRRLPAPRHGLGVGARAYARWDCGLSACAARRAQSGFLSILYSIGSKPLQIWDKQVRNGHIKRLTDGDIQSSVLEIMGTNVRAFFGPCFFLGMRQTGRRFARCPPSTSPAPPRRTRRLESSCPSW